MEPTLKQVKISELKFDGDNPNQLTAEQETDLRLNIEEWGFIQPIIIDQHNTVCDGEHRTKVYQSMGHETIPAYQLTINDSQRRILRQVMNKLHGEHSKELDILELKRIIDGGAQEMLKQLLGSQREQLNKLYAALKAKDRVDEPPVNIPREPKLIKRGDIIELGPHRLMCGDATKREDMKQLMNGKPSQLVFTDPPYNVAYDQDKSPQGKPKGSQGTIKNDDMTGPQFKSFLDKSIKNMMRYNLGAFYICMSCKEWPTIMKTFTDNGGHWSSTIIWNKNSFVLSRQDYHRKFEPILYGWKEGKEHYWCGDRKQSDVWDVQRRRQNKEHPTMKPIELVSKAINNSSKPGQRILDPFGGSGSTLIAAEKTGRECYMMELDPVYCEVIIKRYLDYTNKSSVKINGVEAPWD